MAGSAASILSMVLSISTIAARVSSVVSDVSGWTDSSGGKSKRDSKRLVILILPIARTVPSC
jgi:hypothetical protein